MNLIMPALGYCCTEAQMETTNLYLQPPLQGKRIRTERQTCFFFICLNPPAAESQQLSAHYWFYLILCDIFLTHRCGGVLWLSCLHKQTVCIILLSFWTILHCVCIYA